MVARRLTLHNLDPQFDAGLHDGFVNTVTHRLLQDLIVLFCGPNDVKPLVKSLVSGPVKDRELKSIWRKEKEN